MNENKVKVDISGSLKDFTSHFIIECLGIALVTCMFGLLIAPVWAELFRRKLEVHYDTDHVYTNYHLVEKGLFYIKCVLWVVAILAWTFVLICYNQRGN